jgi:Tol biopolymer transport system component
VLPLVGERKPFPLVEGPFSVFAGQFSPDGRWVAYTSTESGRTEVYVTSFPEASGKWQISTAGGRFPRWRANGKELFYESIDGRLMGVEVESRSGNLSIGQPAALFPMNSRSGTVPFDVSPDGQRFVVNTAGDHASEPINLVVNWPKALRD